MIARVEESERVAERESGIQSERRKLRPLVYFYFCYFLGARGRVTIGLLDYMEGHGMDGFERISLYDIEALGIDYVGSSTMFGKPSKSDENKKYGVFIIARDESLFLVTRCTDLVTALDETHDLMNKFKDSGFDCEVYLSDGCKAILQCMFLAGQEWSERWMGDNISAEYEDDYDDEE